MINEQEAYLIGLLLGKGAIIPINDEQVKLQFKIKFRRPADTSLRADNIHTKNATRDFVESLKSKLSNDFSMIMNILKSTWNMNSTIDLPNSYSLDDWGMKEIIVSSEAISNKHTRLCELLNVVKLDNTSLRKFPFYLRMEANRPIALSFIQGVCDACSLVPNEASSSYGGSGLCRVQIEPSQERWELPIGLCMCFQVGLNIPVNTINWGHPEVRKKWRGQNHQFRVALENIPPEIEIYRLNYKREEYHNLYNRKHVTYDSTRPLCPEGKRVSRGDCYHIVPSNSNDLNSELLDERLRGYSIDIPQKKNVIICKLLGCNRCERFFDLIKDE